MNNLIELQSHSGRLEIFVGLNPLAIQASPSGEYKPIDWTGKEYNEVETYIRKLLKGGGLPMEEMKDLKIIFGRIDESYSQIYKKLRSKLPKSKFTQSGFPDHLTLFTCRNKLQEVWPRVELLGDLFRLGSLFLLSWWAALATLRGMFLEYHDGIDIAKPNSDDQAVIDKLWSPRAWENCDPVIARLLKMEKEKHIIYEMILFVVENNPGILKDYAAQSKEPFYGFYPKATRKTVFCKSLKEVNVDLIPESYECSNFLYAMHRRYNFENRQLVSLLEFYIKCRKLQAIEKYGPAFLCKKISKETSGN